MRHTNPFYGKTEPLEGTVNQKLYDTIRTLCEPNPLQRRLVGIRGRGNKWVYGFILDHSSIGVTFVQINHDPATRDSTFFWSEECIYWHDLRDLMTGEALGPYKELTACIQCIKEAHMLGTIISVTHRRSCYDNCIVTSLGKDSFVVEAIHPYRVGARELRYDRIDSIYSRYEKYERPTTSANKEELHNEVSERGVWEPGSHVAIVGRVPG